jgi:peptide deformylase
MLLDLAAPQVGLPLRLAVIEDEEASEHDRKSVPSHVIVNPTLALGPESA